jgi:hypothetical protein
MVGTLGADTSWKMPAYQGRSSEGNFDESP